MESWTLLVYQLLVLVALTSAYGPFYGNRDLLCNRGTRYVCYCSTVTWRKFNKTDAPLCAQLFPGFEAAVLEMATCDVRLENNQIAGPGVHEEDDESATTFERYFKRTLASLIRIECQQTPKDKKCSKVPTDLGEEHIVFTSYQCSKDLRSSRLWMVVIGKEEEAWEEPQEQTHFVDGSSIARVLTSATVLPQLSSHLGAKNSRVMNVHHLRLEDTYKRTSIPKVHAAMHDPDSERDQGRVSAMVEDDERREDGAVGQYESASDTSAVEGRDLEVSSVPDDHNKFSWVAVIVGGLIILYFVVVWILSIIFCVKKRREIQAKNRRLRGETTGADHGEILDEKQRRHVDFNADPPTTKKLMSKDEDSDYDNR